MKKTWQEYKSDRPGRCCFRAATVGNSLKFARNLVKSAFCDVTKLRNAWSPMVRSQTDYIVFFMNKEKCGKRFRAPLYYFKLFPEQYFFNQVTLQYLDCQLLDNSLRELLIYCTRMISDYWYQRPFYYSIAGLICFGVFFFDEFELLKDFVELNFVFL